MNIVTMSEARKNFFKLGEETHITHKPIIVKGRKFNIIMVDEEDWNSMQETMYLSSIPGMVDSILEADKTPLEECIPYEFG